MIRSVLCCAALFGVGSVASAGELDKEAGPAKSGITAGPIQLSASEMDKESPTDAWHRRGYWGHHHHHHGYYGVGYRPYSYGYGFGYSSYGYRPAYYSPYIGYSSYSGFSGGFGYRGGFVSVGYRGW